MSTWISEKDYRVGRGNDLGIGLNVAFIQEIKEDSVHFRERLDIASCKVFAASSHPRPYDAVVELHQVLSDLRDELETYFAVEEFYGGYHLNSENPDSEAQQLRQEHSDIFVSLVEVCEVVEKMMYHETGLGKISQAVELYNEFHGQLLEHERREMKLLLAEANRENDSS